MNGQDLKSSILQFAMQGKLVEQRPEEGDAYDYYKKYINSIDLSYNLKDLEFDIPETWAWIRINDISSVVTKGTTPRGGKVAYTDKGVGFLRAENVSGFEDLNKDNLKYVDEELHKTFLKRSIINENDILITIAGTLGRTALVSMSDLPLNAN